MPTLWTVLALFCVATSSFAGWVLKETNRDETEVMRVLVQWTKNNATFATEPLTDIDPGKSKEFKPPKEATDWDQTSFFPFSTNPRVTRLKGLVLKETNSFEVGDIADILNPFPIGTEFLIPDPFVFGSELFGGVDLAKYIPAALSTIPASLQITNGTSPLLPGYLIGTTEVNFDHDLGLTTKNPFTGIVVFDATHSLVVVPEPSALFFGGAGLCWLVWQLRKTAN